MNRKFKALALALAAVFAFSAIAASTAMAENGTLTADGPVTLTGEDMSGTETTLTALGLTVACTTKYTMGELKQTPHKDVKAPTSKITVLRDVKCTLKSGMSVLSATVTSNKCDFERRFLLREGESNKWEMASDVVCENAEPIEIHAYSDAKHTTSICTIKIPAQTGLTGGFVENMSGGKIKMGGPITGIKVSKTGILCGGSAETSTGEEDLSVEIKGANEAGEPTAIELS